MKRIVLKMALLCLAVISGGAQATALTTTFSSNNGQSGNMFDVVTLGGALNVNAFDLNLNPGTWNIEVYEKSGSWVGFNSNPGAWTLIDSGTVTSAGTNNATHFDVADFMLNAVSTSALYITGTVADTAIFAYTDGTAVGNIAASNTDLQILEGAGISYAFGNSFTPRIWNGSIYYTQGTVPEPATLALLGLGLLGLSLSRRRKV